MQGKKIITAAFILFLLSFIALKMSSFEVVCRAVLGIFFFIGIGYLLSENKKKIDWFLIIKGIILQIIIALLVLKVSFVQEIFEKIAYHFIQIVSFSKKGTDFLLASFVSGKIESPLINFSTTVIPAILFFSALSAILYYLGIIQKIIYFLSFFMQKTLKISGAESLTSVANIFLGPFDAALLIRNYLPQMNKSEIMLLMTGGMATIAGSVMTAYIFYLGGDDEVERAIFAQHLMAASLMSAPAAIVMAKLIIPQNEKISEKMTLNSETRATNFLEAIADGTADGLKLAVNVAVMLLVFTALIALVNDFILAGMIGKYTGLNHWISLYTNYPNFSIEFILGYVLAPFTYLMGVAKEDIFLVAQLLGEKTLLNEFIAYGSLGKMKQADVFFEKKSIIIATYLLCGFSNFGSVGMLVGGIGALVPSQKKILTEVGFQALWAASLACILTGIIAGMII